MLFDDIQKLIEEALASPQSGDDVVEKTATSESDSSVSEELIDFVDNALEESEQDVSPKVALAQLLIAGDVLAKGRF